MLYIMMRTQLYLTEEQHRRLKARARAAGRTLSDEVREAVDSHLADDAGGPDGARHRRESFAARMRVRPGWRRAESGEALVERLRTADAERLTEHDRRRSR